MNETEKNVTAIAPARRLADAIRDVKNAAADQGDVIVEMREAARHRLELLAVELESVFDEVPADEPYFDFAISSGLQPRLWIDAVAYVSMGRDRRTYRFVRDTRLGTVVLAESGNVEPVAEQITKYIAERLVEREKLMAGEAEDLRHLIGVPPSGDKSDRQQGIMDSPEADSAESTTGVTGAKTMEKESSGHPVRDFLIGFVLVVFGMMLAAAILGVIYRERLPALGIDF